MPNKPSLKKLQQELKEHVAIHKKNIASDNFSLGQTLDDIGGDIIQIGDNKLYLAEYDPPEDDVCFLAYGSTLTKVNKEDAKELMMKKFREEIMMYSLKIKNNSSVYLPQYIEKLANQDGFLSLGQTAIQSYLVQNQFMEHYNYSDIKTKRKFKFTIEDDKIKFTEEFELHNYFKYDGKDILDTPSGHNATITLDSYISLSANNTILHEFGNIEVERHNDLGYELFPPKNLDEYFTRVKNQVSKFFSACCHYFNENILKKKQSSFAKISNRLNDEAFNTKQDSKALEKQLVALESDKSLHKLILAKQEITNTYARMRSEYYYERGDINSNGRRINSSLDTMEEFNETYLQEMEKKIQDLEVKINFVQDESVRNRMLDRIDELEEHMQQARHYKNSARKLAQLMINIGDIKQSPDYKKLIELKKEIEQNNQSNNIEEFVQLHGKIRDKFEQKITSFDTEGSLHSTKDEWNPPTILFDKEKNDIENFLDNVRDLVNEVSSSSEYDP